MYAIYGDIYHQYTPVMLAYMPYMDPMGKMFFSAWYLLGKPIRSGAAWSPVIQ